MTTTRREWFRRAATGTLGVGLAATTAALADTTIHAGWTLQWSGWRSVEATDMVYAFWTAVRGEERWYSTSGGTVGPYQLGHVFNCCNRAGFDYLTLGTPQAVLDTARLDTLARLKDALPA